MRANVASTPPPNAPATAANLCSASLMGELFGQCGNSPIAGGPNFAACDSTACRSRAPAVMDGACPAPRRSPLDRLSEIRASAFDRRSTADSYRFLDIGDTHIGGDSTET